MLGAFEVFVHEVSWMFHDCFKGVSNRFQEGFKEVSKMFHGTYKDVSRMLQKCSKEISNFIEVVNRVLFFLDSFKDVTRFSK